MFWKNRVLTPIDPYKGSALVELNFITKIFGIKQSCIKLERLSRLRRNQLYYYMVPEKN